MTAESRNQAWAVPLAVGLAGLVGLLLAALFSPGALIYLLAGSLILLGAALAWALVWPGVWWIVPLVAGAFGLIAVLLALLLLPGAWLTVLAIAAALLGASFLWAFFGPDVWWAVVPGILALSLALVALVYQHLPPNNGWVALLIVGIGAYVIAVLPNPRVEINLSYLVGIVLVLIAILLSPLRPVWKALLCAGLLALVALTVWLDREDLRRIWA